MVDPVNLPLPGMINEHLKVIREMLQTQNDLLSKLVELMNPQIRIEHRPVDTETIAKAATELLKKKGK